MSDAPVHEIDPAAFRADPYPDLARMRAIGPFVRVPQLGATLVVRRAEVVRLEKRIDIFSSHQPGGLMTRLMGENMMRKDGEAHLAERRAIFPTVSPRTVRDVWRGAFERAAEAILDRIAGQGRADLVADYALPLSAEALKAITGLTNMAAAEMDRVSQGMIDGIANYHGDPAVEARCHDCTASIDRHIDERLTELARNPDSSLISVQMQAGLSDSQMRANVKLAISGGQNEPRDAIAGAAWALLTHPEARAAVMQGRASWMQVFEEYARWIAPIGMSPRRIAAPYAEAGVSFEPEERAFLMFGSANRDERVWDRPERFDIFRDVGPSVAFGAGPHFCAGAWASRALIAEVALPRLFARLPALQPDGPVRFDGWAFRGPLSVPVAWD